MVATGLVASGYEGGLASQRDPAIAAGQIAVELFISTATVRNYLSSIVAKLHARTQLDAVRIAVDAGWI